MTRRRATRTTVCLRCDWSGATTATACPACGAGLYREPPPGAVSHASASGEPASLGALASTHRREGSHDERDVGLVEGAGLYRRLLVVVVLVSLAAGAVWLLAERRTQGPAPASDALLRGGTLVYAVDEAPGWSRLWRWDLTNGSVRRGPRVRQPIELVNADGAEPGIVGVTSRVPDGDLIGSLLRFLSPSDGATPLVRGDLITWGSRGASVVVVKRGPLLGPCRRRLAIVIKTIVPGLVEQQFDRTMCGDILSVGRDSNTTYFTWRRRERVDLVSAGFGRTHHVLSDFALLSISPASDMIVVPSDALPTPALSLAILRDRGDVPPPSVFGTSSFFRGLRGAPRPYRSGSDRLWIDRVLAWSRDSSVALVAGRLADRVGVYEISAGPGRRTDAPRWVGPIQGATWATFAEDGLAFVWTDDRLFLTRGGGLEPLSIPEGAPRPDGPMVWLG